MIKLKNVSKYYSSNESVALGLRKINLEFHVGEFIAITGESGSGKSTLLNVISGLDTYEEGELYIGGQATRHFREQEWEDYRNQYISFVFQKYNIIDSYTVYQNLEAALIVKGIDPQKMKEKIKEIIEKVHLKHKLHQKASTLSGGEIQRAVIARALAKDSQIIVCDEPTGNIDSKTSLEIMELLHEISKERLVIVVTHDYDIVAPYCTRKIRLLDGEIAEDKVLKEVPMKKENIAKYSPHSLTLKEYVKVTLNNLLSAPKRTLFMLFVFFFISFVFLLTLGARLNQESLDSFYGYGPFREASNSRIIVTKRDYTSFTSNEITQLKQIDKVKGVLDYDVVLDLRVLNAEYNDLHNTYDYNEYMMNSVLSIDESELLKGRLPENDNEIVVGPLFDVPLDTTLELAFSNKNISTIGGGDTTVVREYKVVGTYKSIFPETIRSNAYFTTNTLNELGAILLTDYTDINLYPTNLDFDKEGRTELYIIINNDLPLNQVVVSNDVYTENCFYYIDRTNCSSSDNEEYFNNTDFLLSGTSQYSNELTTVPVTITYDPMTFGFHVSEETLQQVIDKEIYQPSVIIKDGFDQEEVISKIEELGFKAFYPAGVEEEMNLILIIITRLQFIVNMLIVLLVSYFISYYVLRNIMLSKNKDYLIFRSFGTSKKTLNKVVALEITVLAMFGYSCAVLLLFLNESYGRFIPKYIRYYHINDFVMLFVILIVLVLLLVRRFNQRIFSKSVITSMNRN